MTREPRARWSAPKARDLRACSAWRERIGTSSSAKIPITKIVPMPIARAYPGPGATLSSVDGLLDWYLLGVVLGLGVVAGVGLAGALSSGPWVALALAAAAGAVTVALLALPWWTLVALAAAALVAFAALRKLSPAALPAAALGALVLAALPALGYLAAVATPVAGARLGRRAGSRYAGLRVLAKD